MLSAYECLNISFSWKTIDIDRPHSLSGGSFLSHRVLTRYALFGKQIVPSSHAALEKYDLTLH